MGNFRQSERALLKINLKNSLDIINPQNSIITLDRGFMGLEVMAWMVELGFNFVQRIKSGAYTDEISKIKTQDSPIKIKLNASRMRGFHDPELKEKYSKRIYTLS